MRQTVATSALRPVPGKLGGTLVQLPLGGTASTDQCQVRPPGVRPFWLLAAMASAAVGVFVWLRLLLQ